MKFTLYTANCTGNEKNILYPNQKVITSEADLKKAVVYDHVCAQYENFARSDANFLLSDVVPMDCDNDHSDDPKDWITQEKLASFLSDVAFAVTYSRHHMLAKGNKSARPRFHVFFPTAPCNDANSHKAIKQKIHKELPFFDGNALDASRFLFGCPSDVVWHEGSLSIEDWLTLMKSNRNIPQGQRNSTMSRMAGKLVKRFGVTEESYQKFLEKAAECEPPLPDEELEAIWHSACKFGKKVTSQEGYISPEAYGKQSLIPDDFSDVGEARTFVEGFSDEVAFAIATDYLRYNGTYWEESEHAVTLAMIEHTDVQLAEAEKQVEASLLKLESLGVARDAAINGGKKFRDSLDEEQIAAYKEYQYYAAFKAFVMKYRHVRSMTNALDAAKPLVLHNPEALDSNPMLLNTPGGTYYLPEGLNGWKPTDPADLLTKVTAVVPSDAGKDLWENALQLFFCGDQSLIDYVQMICGLCIVGKVYLEAMIIAAELQEGMRLNTSVVKQLCSTDPIFAEKKFKAPFHFEPSHTLVQYTNHLPKVGASDDGTWRRLIVIPFHAKIQGSKDIKNYTQHLVDHAGGAVLSWLIEGARKVIAANYQINRPQCVLDAIGAYRDGNDWLGNFINECCEADKSYQAKSGDLYNRYREYCNENGEYTRSTSDFYAALEQAGFKKTRTHSARYIMGLQLKNDILD